MNGKLLYGIALVACAVGVFAAEGGAGSKQVTPEDCSGCSIYAGTTDCGLANVKKYFVDGGCVTLGDANLNGICFVDNAGSYINGCEDCYDFGLLKAFGKNIGVNYGKGGSIKSGTAGAPAGEDCEWSKENCGSCEVLVADCLRNTAADFDFTTTNPRDHCCNPDPATAYCPTGPFEYRGVFGYCGTCTEDLTGDGDRCPTIVDNVGGDCYPNSDNLCIKGTCTLVDDNMTCLGSEAVSCDDGNECTIDPECVAATGCADETRAPRAPAPTTTPCATDDACEVDCTCDGQGQCGSCSDKNCPEGTVCASDQNGLCVSQRADLAPFFLAGAGGLLLLAGAAGVLAKKRNSAMADEKRASVMSQKSDMTRGGFAAAAGSRKSATSQQSRFTRGPGATAAGASGTHFDQVSHATRRSTGGSAGRRSTGSASRGSRVSRATTATRSSTGSAGRRSNGSRGRSVGGVSNGTRSSAARSSGSGKSHNSRGTRSSGGSAGRRSNGSRGRH